MYCPDGRSEGALAVWRGKVVQSPSRSNSTNCHYLPSMQGPCTTCLVASRGEGLRKLLTSNRCQSEYNKNLVFDFVKNSSSKTFKILKRCRQMQLNNQIAFILQLQLCLDYLHNDLGIVHGAVRPDHVLIASANRCCVKLTNFSNAHMIGSSVKMNRKDSGSRSQPWKKQLNRLKSFLIQRTTSLKVTPGSRFRSTRRSVDVSVHNAAFALW